MQHEISNSEHGDISAMVSIMKIVPGGQAGAEMAALDDDLKVIREKARG